MNTLKFWKAAENNYIADIDNSEQYYLVYLVDGCYVNIHDANSAGWQARMCNSDNKEIVEIAFACSTKEQAIEACNNYHNS